MDDLSLHVLDIAENGIRAGADRIRIELDEDAAAGRLAIAVTDNGSGMDAEMVRAALDPFVTTRTERRVGLGLPLLAQSAREAGGEMAVKSEVGRGTKTTAWFQLDHIDCRPIGDMAETLVTLILGNPETDFVFVWKRGEDELEIDTAELKGEMGAAALSDVMVLGELKRQIAGAIEALRAR